MLTWQVAKGMAVACAVAGTVAVAMARAPQTTWDGVYTEEQATAGETAFQAHCATCHMPDMDGGEDAPPLVGAVFSGVWNGRSVGELARKIRTRMPQDDPGSLSREAVADIVAAILHRNGFPAGGRRLPASDADLAGIVYAAQAPR